MEEDDYIWLIVIGVIVIAAAGIIFMKKKSLKVGAGVKSFFSVAGMLGNSSLQTDGTIGNGKPKIDDPKGLKMLANAGAPSLSTWFVFMRTRESLNVFVKSQTAASKFMKGTYEHHVFQIDNDWALEVTYNFGTIRDFILYRKYKSIWEARYWDYNSGILDPTIHLTDNPITTSGTPQFTW